MSMQPVNRSQTLFHRYWPVLLLAACALIPLIQALVRGEAIGPFDQIRQMAPWNGAKPSQPWDVLQADGVLQFYVWRDMVFRAWGSGQIPFWNSYQLAGTPLLANSQSAALYPPHIVIGLLHVPTAAGMMFLAWLHLFWAGLGTYLLARRMGADRIGALVSGLSFALGNFMIAWTGLPSVIETVSWIPWILAFLFDLFEPDAKRAYRGFAFAATCVAMMFLAGHLQFAAYGMLAATVATLWWLGSSLLLTRKSSRATSEAANVPRDARPWRSATLSIAAMGLGVILAGPQLFAVLQFSQFSHRRNVPTEVGYTSYIGGSIQPFELVKTILPTIQGNPRQFAAGLPVSTFYPSIVKSGDNFAESAIGLGVFVFALLCLFPVCATKRDPTWGILAVGALGLLIALGTPVNRIFYFLVPGWSSTGSPGRAICLFVLAACVAAGVATSQLAELKEQKKRLQVAGGIFGLLCAVFYFLKDGFALPKNLSPSVIDAIQSQAESAALPTAIGVSLLALGAVFLAARERSSRSNAALVAIPIVSCIAFLGMSLIQTGKPNLTIKNDVGNERVAIMNDSWGLLTSSHAILPPNLPTLSQIHSLDGYDSLIHRDTDALLHDIDGTDPAPAANGNIMFVKPGADIRKLSQAGVTRVWSKIPISNLGSPIVEQGVYKYTIPGPGRASTPSGPATILSETPTHIKIAANGPGKLIVRERNMPGWLAKVDGAHVPISGSTWIELDLPEGAHQVQLNYVAPGFMAGLYVAFPAWIAVLLLALGSFRIRRSGKT